MMEKGEQNVLKFTKATVVNKQLENVILMNPIETTSNLIYCFIRAVQFKTKLNNARERSSSG